MPTAGNRRDRLDQPRGATWREQSPILLSSVRRLRSSRNRSVLGAAELPVGARRCRRRYRRSQQRFTGGPLAADVQRFEELHLATREQCDAIAIEQAVAGKRRELGPGVRMPARRVGSGQGHPRAGGRFASDLTQHADGVRQRELFSGETGGETAAADFPTRFEPAVDPQQLPLDHHVREAADQLR